MGYASPLSSVLRPLDCNREMCQERRKKQEAGLDRDEDEEHKNGSWIKGGQRMEWGRGGCDRTFRGDGFQN